MNVIAIVIDTLRYDYIGANGNDWIQTPNLDRLAEDSWCFDRCFAAAFPTIPHRLDMMTGRHGEPFHAWMPLPYDWETLPRALADAGYATQLIHDTPHLVNGGHHFDWPFQAWTFIRGAEVDRPWIDDREGWPANWKRDEVFDAAGEVNWPPQFHTYLRANRDRRDREDWNAARLFRTAARFLEDNRDREKFFLWVDCFDPHEPWDAPPEFMKKYVDSAGYDGTIDPRSFYVRNSDELPDEARQRIAAAYAAKVSWMDHCLGQFLDTFESTGLADNTAIVLTADHGTRVGDRGRYGKGGRIPEGVAHVPLFVRPPGGEHGRSEMFLQPQDVYATVCGLVGLDGVGGRDSSDALSAARAGNEGPRSLALSGGSADGWSGDSEGYLFTVFAEDGYLELAADPEAGRLYEYGGTTDLSSEAGGAVRELHEAGIDEVERRGADPDLVGWLRGHGEAEFPEDAVRHRGWPPPPGYDRYWKRLYKGDGERG